MPVPKRAFEGLELRRGREWVDQQWQVDAIEQFCIDKNNLLNEYPPFYADVQKVKDLIDQRKEENKDLIDQQCDALVQEIYDTYIKDGARYQVNLSDTDKNELMQKRKTGDFQEIYNVLKMMRTWTWDHILYAGERRAQVGQAIAAAAPKEQVVKKKKEGFFATVKSIKSKFSKSSTFTSYQFYQSTSSLFKNKNGSNDDPRVVKKDELSNKSRGPGGG
ncbi:MAG: hypothetical protein EPO11_01880 [Gammaproteobacteria bacterium]|nr:MAG: hypothetical protein EPO11_01880 [Gammaproteobacteria bacterium]